MKFLVGLIIGLTLSGLWTLSAAVPRATRDRPGVTTHCDSEASPGGLLPSPCVIPFTLRDVCLYLSNRGFVAVLRKEPGMRCD